VTKTTRYTADHNRRSSQWIKLFKENSLHPTSIHQRKTPYLLSLWPLLFAFIPRSRRSLQRHSAHLKGGSALDDKVCFPPHSPENFSCLFGANVRDRQRAATAINHFREKAQICACCDTARHHLLKKHLLGGA